MFRLGILFAAALVSVLVGCKQNRSGNSVKLAAVGDTNGYKILRDGTSDDPLKEVRGSLESQDLFIENFEGVILSHPASPAACPAEQRQSAFFGPPEIADFLHPTAIAIATLANNHISDCGLDGIVETTTELRRRGVLVGGAGRNLNQACAPIRLEIDGVQLAVLAYLAIDDNRLLAGPNNPGAASWTACRGDAQVAALAAAGYIVVVAMHLHQGPAWNAEPSERDLTLVKRALDAGADLVIGHGPHVPQGIVESNGRVGLLSLGDFLVHPDYEIPESAKRSIIAQITISANTIDVRLLPIRLDRAGRPIVPAPWDASWILNDIAEQSARLGTKMTIENGIGRFSVQRRREK